MKKYFEGFNLASDNYSSLRPTIFRFVETTSPLNDVVLYSRFEKKMKKIYENLSNRKNYLINEWENIRPYEFTQSEQNQNQNLEPNDIIICLPKKGAYKKEIDGSIYDNHTRLYIESEKKIHAGWRYRYVKTNYTEIYSGIDPDDSEWTYFEYRNKILPWSLPKYTMKEYQYTIEMC